MKPFEKQLKDALEEKIQEYIDQMSETDSWEKAAICIHEEAASKQLEKLQEKADSVSETDSWEKAAICIHEEAASNMTSAAWAVFEAMYKSQEVVREIHVS